MTEEIETYKVGISEITNHWNPFLAWTGNHICNELLQKCIADRDVESRHLTELDDVNLTEEEEELYHARRIAWFFHQKDETPIEIDVGCPSLGFFPSNRVFEFLDGNHRLCAAILREDETIKVTYGGECDQFIHVFPNAKRIV